MFGKFNYRNSIRQVPVNHRDQLNLVKELDKEHIFCLSFIIITQNYIFNNKLHYKISFQIFMYFSFLHIK